MAFDRLRPNGVLFYSCWINRIPSRFIRTGRWMIGGTLDNCQRLFDRRNRPAWVVLLVCLSLTLVTWYGLRVQAMKSAEQQFELHVRDVVYSIEERLRQLSIPARIVAIADIVEALRSEER